MKSEQVNDSTIPNHYYPKCYPTLCISNSVSSAGNRKMPTEILLFSGMKHQLCSEIHVDVSLYLFRVPLILTNSETKESTSADASRTFFL